MSKSVYSLTLTFTGDTAEQAREAIWVYLLDGGGQDAFLSVLEQNAGLQAEMEWETDGRTVTFDSRPGEAK